MSIVAANSAGMEIKMVMKSAVQNHISIFWFPQSKASVLILNIIILSN
jgi:hypothetical protein